MPNTANNRIEALDVFRGLALALMLLVNNPGSWSFVYAPFLHAEWNGLTPTDLVFPFFLFVVGASMACSLRNKVVSTGLPWVSVLRRASLLFLIGFVLNIVPFDQPPENWRVMGVLQRIGLSFLIVAVLISFIKERWLPLTGMIILICYWLMMTGLSDAPYSLNDNIVRHFDIFILGDTHLWQGKGLSFDPEGLLSNLPAAVTVLVGYIIGIKIQQYEDTKQQLQFLTLSGVILVIMGSIWSIWHPINKSLWTGSFVLVTAGIACMTLSAIVLLWSAMKMRIGLTALQIYGSNPIFIYVAAWLFAVLLGRITIGNPALSLQTYGFSYLQSLMPDKAASLVYALCFTLIFYAVAWVLHRKQIFVKL
jgi:predicted acyltransferase